MRYVYVLRDIPTATETAVGADEKSSCKKIQENPMAGWGAGLCQGRGQGVGSLQPWLSK